MFYHEPLGACGHLKLWNLFLRQGNPHSGSVTLDHMVIMTAMFGKRLTVNCGLQAGWEPGTYHNPKCYILTEVQVSIGEQKYLTLGFTEDETQHHLNKFVLCAHCKCAGFDSTITVLTYRFLVPFWLP
jgi:hypothetical protein